MITQLLSRLSSCPGAVFYERELREVNAVAFDELRAAGLLSNAGNLGVGDTIDYGTGARLLTIVQGPEGKLEAADPDDPEFPVLRLDEDICRQWRISLDTVARRLEAANQLDGAPVEISDRLYFVGEAEQSGVRTAFVLALVRGASAARVLPSLRGLLPMFSRFTVLAPGAVDPMTEGRLAAAGISLVVLDPEDPFRIQGLGVAPAESVKSKVTTSTFKHNEPFTSVTLNGREFPLTQGQACAVRFLHEARSRGHPSVEHDRIIAHLHQHRYSTHRLRDLFAGSQAWGTLVVSPRRGLYQIAD